MFGNVTDLPQLHTYRAALMHYNSITPIRGSDNLRPICNTANGRRKKHMQIVRVSYPSKQGALDAVACRLYDTDVVTFLSNGEIIINIEGWSTNTTHSFIDGLFMPTGYYFTSLVRAYSRKGNTVIELKDATTVLKDDNVVKIRMVEETDTQGKYFEFVDAPKQHGYYLKRAQMGMRRKELEKFAKFARAAAKMIDPETYEDKTWSTFEGRKAVTAGQLHSMMLDQSQWDEALDYLLPMALHSEYQYAPPANTYKRVTTIKPATLTKKVDDVLKYMFAEDLFEERETNNPLSNDNAKYLTGAEAVIK